MITYGIMKKKKLENCRLLSQSKICIFLHIREKKMTHDDFTWINYIFSKQSKFGMPSTCTIVEIVDFGFNKHPKSYVLVPTSQTQFLFITQYRKKEEKTEKDPIGNCIYVRCGYQSLTLYIQRDKWTNCMMKISYDFFLLWNQNFRFDPLKKRKRNQNYRETNVKNIGRLIPHSNQVDLRDKKNKLIFLNINLQRNLHFLFL